MKIVNCQGAGLYLYPAKLSLLLKGPLFFQLPQQRALSHFRGLRTLVELTLFGVNQNPAVAQALRKTANERLIGLPFLFSYFKPCFIHPIRS